MTLIGCGADANPTPRVTPGAAAAHGRAIADEVNRLLKGPWTSLPAPPVARSSGSSFPFDTLPTRAQLEATGQGQGAGRLQRLGPARQARPRRAAPGRAGLSGPGLAVRRPSS